MTNPMLTWFCQTVEPELMRLKPVETQVVAIPPASLVGKLELEFASWCHERGFTVMRNQTAGVVAFTIGKPLDPAGKRDRVALEAVWEKFGTAASPNLTILCQCVEKGMNQLKPGQTMGIPAPHDWTAEMEGPFRAWCQVMDYDLIDVSSDRPPMLGLRKRNADSTSSALDAQPFAAQGSRET
jgi:hypothetical protein